MQEIQINNILNEATALKRLTDEPLAKKVLEIEVDATSAQKKELLFRVIRSLDQYINKQDHLVYVSFVGHYSSGKSSTINNLLDLNQTSDRRHTGLNPTDKAITLITDTSNSNSLILMNRESATVPIRTALIRNAFLESLVIADTPGSGDPQVVNEMIQDFLPICDYVLYFISAANPMDQADLPLLQQKTHKLPFIPIIFAITRTDEFRIDKTLQLNDHNIDRPKQDVFIGQLISRIKEIIKTDKISVDDFIFIDNEFKYKLTELKSKIKSWASGLDHEAKIKNHGYKVEYYRGSLDSIHQHFINVIDEKIRKSKDFLKTANDNIQRFDKSIELNNEKLRILWTRGDTTFKAVYLNEKSQLNDLVSHQFSPFITSFDLVNAERKTIGKSIDDIVNGYVGKIVGDINIHIKQRLRDIKHNLLSNINNENILSENISHLFPGRLDLTYPLQTVDIDFSKLNDYTTNYHRAVASSLQDAKNDIKSRTTQFRSIIQKEAIVLAINQLYSQGKTIINENFDQYFEKIQMYKSTVLTRNTKETIEKLRIGTQLDELDFEFSDEFMSEMKRNATLEVYFSNDNEITDLKKTNEAINQDLLQIRKATDETEVPNSIEKPTLGKEAIDISALSTSITNNSERILNKLYQEKLHEVLDKHAESYNEYLDSIKQVRQDRKRKIVTWTIVVGFIATFFYFILRFSNIIKPSTISFEILFALGTTALGNIVGLVYSRAQLDFKKLSSNNKDLYIKQEKSLLLQLFNEDYWEELSRKFNEIRPDANATVMKSLFDKKMEPILKNVATNGQGTLDKLLTRNKEFIELTNKYRTGVDFFYQKHSLIFLEADANVCKIEKITKHIKETAIKPSFDLLNETADNLIKVKHKIQTETFPATA